MGVITIYFDGTSVENNTILLGADEKKSSKPENNEDFPETDLQLEVVPVENPR